MSALCSVCNKSFSCKSNLNRHSIEVHNLELDNSYEKSKYMYKCLEENCCKSYRNNRGLKDHLIVHHNKVIECKKLEFSNNKEFIVWKRSIEKINKSNYVLSSTSKLKSGLVKYYLCNRSGKVERKSLNKRVLKKQGSCKLNRNCISMIKFVEGEKISVTWIKTHYGHTLDLQHLRLSEEDKSIVASQLMLGVSPAKILDSFRDKIISHNLDRKNLLKRKDIQNIKKSYHTKNILSSDFDTHNYLSENEETGNIHCVKKCRNKNCCDLKCNNCNVCYSLEKSNTLNKSDILKQIFPARAMDVITKLQNTDLNALDNDIIKEILSHLDVIEKLLDTSYISNEQSYVSTDHNY